MAQVARTEAVSVYRYLLRSIGIAFHGDATTLSAARREARRTFEEGRKLATAEAVEGIEEARSVGKFLRQNLVQGVKEETDEVYSMLTLIKANDRITDTRRN